MAYSGRLKITTARFANVAFSNGSLPQGFIERLHEETAMVVPAGDQALLRLTAGVGRAVPDCIGAWESQVTSSSRSWMRSVT